MTSPPFGVNRINEIDNLNRYRKHLPDSAIIWRTWHPKEGNWSILPPPAEQVRLWKNEGSSLRAIVRDDPSNEPSLPHQRMDLMTRYVQDRTELLNRAADEGIRVAVGAFSVGTPHESLIENGLFDPLLRAIHAGNHMISYHSYSPGIPGAGDLVSFDVLRDPLKAATMLRERDRRWEPGRYWYLRRTDFFRTRAQQLGLPPPPIMMTEAVFDDVLSTQSFYGELRHKYGLPQYMNDLRGVTSWRKYWSAAFPNQSLYDVLDMLLLYLKRNVFYLDDIRGVCLFSINKGWETRGHNWAHPDLMEYIIKRLPLLNREQQTTPEPPAPTPPTVTTPAPAPAKPVSGSGLPISHAFVLPDADFRTWLTALQPYLSKFERVAVVRSPAGNDLNPYRNVTAVTASNLWMQDDPIRHIRRIYPQVVRVDVIQAKTPQEMATVLQSRISANDRYGEKNNGDNHLSDRFVLEWPTDTLSMRIVRPFTSQPTGTDADNPGIEIQSSAGAKVYAAATGKVTGLWANAQPDALRLGKYVQITSTDGATTYTVIYAGLAGISATLNSTVAVGDEIGQAAGATISLIVQSPRGASGYRLPNIIDPTPLIQVTDLRLRPTSNGLRIRSAPEKGTILGQVNTWELLTPREQHGRLLSKVGTEGEWLRVRLPDGRNGFAAAWYLQGTVSRRPFAGVNPVGINLDQLHPLGTPDATRLGGLGWVRFGYNVSNNTGSEDIIAAFNRYAPLAERYVKAGYRVIFATSHQTYGEGKNEFWPWPEMSDQKWAILTERFADIMGRISKQWAGKGLVHCWQVWNEQDAPIGAVASVPMTAQNYSRMLTRVIPAIRSADSQVYVITGGHTGGPTRGSEYARTALRALPAGVAVDGIACHPYGRGPNTSSIYTPFGHIDDEIKAYTAVLPDKPIWLTEWGVLDRPNDSATDIANYATDFISYIKARYPEQVACMIWYAWAQGMHNGYGIVDSGGNPRAPLTDRFLKS
jgi:murein DD-endopeptidase MepM/ murein hydrolase activator NlpD